MYAFYAEVDDSMKVSEGGGNAREHERIEVVYIPKADIKQLIFDETYRKSGLTAFCVMWWINDFNKEKQLS